MSNNNRINEEHVELYAKLLIRRAAKRDPRSIKKTPQEWACKHFKIAPAQLVYEADAYLAGGCGIAG